MRWYLPIGGSEILIDFQFCDAVEYEPMLLFFTGSKEFNMKMREPNLWAMPLNQYGLWERDNRDMLVARTEQDIFKALNMPYQKPTQRG